MVSTSLGDWKHRLVIQLELNWSTPPPPPLSLNLSKYFFFPFLLRFFLSFFLFTLTLPFLPFSLSLFITHSRVLLLHLLFVKFVFQSFTFNKYFTYKMFPVILTAMILNWRNNNQEIRKKWFHKSLFSWTLNFEIFYCKAPKFIHSFIHWFPICLHLFALFEQFFMIPSKAVVILPLFLYCQQQVCGIGPSHKVHSCSPWNELEVEPLMFPLEPSSGRNVSNTLVCFIGAKTNNIPIKHMCALLISYY